MKTLTLAFIFCFCLCAWGKDSKVIPKFLEAAEIYVHQGPELRGSLVLGPEIRKILDLLDSKMIPTTFLEKHLSHNKDRQSWPLPPDDRFDLWQKKPEKTLGDVPEVALHAFRMDVVEDSDDWTNDDIYVYFFITDGVIPTGKVTSIYKGLDEGQSFFFNEYDRAIFPLIGIPAKRPDNHLIVDYGIVESDGDDIGEMQKLSSIIVDIAIAVYTSMDPEASGELMNLRKETKALAELLLGLNHDDRLVTSSFGFKASELNALFGNESYFEFTKKHKKDTILESWDYRLNFRMIRR